MLTRRAVCALGGALAASRLLTRKSLLAALVGRDAESSRPDVAAIDREHTLQTAEQAILRPSSGNLLSGAVPALTAAAVLLRSSDPDRAARYGRAAAGQLRALLLAPETRLNDELTETNAPEDIVPLAPLAEIAQSLPFLSATDAWLPGEQAHAAKGWFARLSASLNGSRTGGLARDRKDHVGGVWLLVAAACAHAAEDDTQLAALRHRYKSVTIRAQISADGAFSHELTTRLPYRNSLFALDLLAGATELLSTHFESLWDYALQDGPGLRVAIARHAPWIANRAAWPYPADQSHFGDMPCRRTSMLLAARAYSRPEYAGIWREASPPEPQNAELLAAFPLRQPLLWVARPRP